IFYRNMPTSSDEWKPLAPGFSIPPKHKTGLPSSTFGPELGFAKAMLAANPKKKLALIKGSKGGSSLRVDWNPGTHGDDSTQGTRYRDFIKTIKIATGKLDQRGDSYKIQALLWHQGESDSKSPANVYQERLEKFIDRVREDVKVPGLPVVVGEVFDNGKRDGVRTAIRTVGTKGENTGLVSSEDLTTWDEGTHFDAASQLTLGKRYAEAVSALLPR
ncbi:MAG: sialate O-acetylesterase, partial [Rubripirellula sp.]